VPPVPPVPPVAPTGISDDHEGDHEVQVVKDRFVIHLTNGEEANLVLKSGTPVTLESDDGKISIDSSDPKIGMTVTEEPDGGVSIARSDVRVLNVENDDGQSFNYVSGMNGADTHWKIHSDDDDVSVDQDKQQGTSSLVAKSGNDKVVIDGNHIQIDDEDGSHISIAGLSGMSALGSVLLFGIGFMIVGALGLWLCIWISRLTWRGLARYVKYQISIVTGNEPFNTIG